MALIDVIEFGRRLGFDEKKRNFSYELARRLPPGVRVELGPRKVRINEEKLQEWIDQGGTLSNEKNGNGESR